jgi:ribonucrease Y
MEILIAAVVLAVGLVTAASLLARRTPGLASAPVRPKATPVAAPPVAAPPVAPAAGEPQAVIATTDDGKSAERRADLLRLEERLRAREEAVESRLSELGERERLLTIRAAELENTREHHVRELERVAGMSASQARNHLLKEVEDQIRHDRARILRHVEEETKRDADRRVRNILSVVM